MTLDCEVVQSRSGVPAMPTECATSSPSGVETTTSARCLRAPETLDVMVNPVRSEAMSSLSMCAARTGSIHTVCQMPDAPV